jgi:type I restriction enzyme, S subunit
MKNKKPATTQQRDDKPGLTPKLRFPEFRNEEQWKVKPFAGLFSIGNGRDHKHLSLGNIPVYGSGGYMRSVDEYLHDGESVCIGRKGTINNPMFLTGKFWTVDTLFYTHSFNQCLPKFVFSIFQNIDWLKHNEAGGVPSLSKTNIEKIETALPSLAEQQKIAECLSSVDELIAAQAQKLDALKTHKLGLMQQLFPRAGEAQPRLRFPEFRNAGEWEVSELGSVCDVRDGTHDSPEFFQSGRPLVTSKNLGTDGTLDLKNVNLISEQAYDQISKRSKVSVGDILFGMIGTIGNPVILKSAGFAIKNVALIKQLKSLTNLFLVQLLQSEYISAIFAVLNSGNSQKFIALGKIRGLLVPVPDLAEQRRIANCLSSLDDLINFQTQKLDTLKTHKKGLMQQLFPSPEELEA